jgi:squalene-hopene/tetraprenyl-beta-curcumene cyclase
MSLAAVGRADGAVTQRGLDFLHATARDDGSWPIDSDLSTWVTTLSVNALAAGGRAVPEADAVGRWLLGRQHAERHPFTDSAPGGWAWTHRPGGVPDADDTAGALLALATLSRAGAPDAARRGARCLHHLQNRDGGWPTFCRGWGRLPFDRSAPDLTAHVLRALARWPREAGAPRAIRRGLAYLRSSQRQDGAWTPLWFGNQRAPGHQNPVYGTARVLLAYRDLGRLDAPPAGRGVAWLLAAQNAAGGWGGAAGVESSIEETALAVEALAAWREESAVAAACRRGGLHLAERIADGGLDSSTPIGLYFARLWYSERLYPIIFAVAALGTLLSSDDESETP